MNRLKGMLLRLGFAVCLAIPLTVLGESALFLWAGAIRWSDLTPVACAWIAGTIVAFLVAWWNNGRFFGEVWFGTLVLCVVFTWMVVPASYCALLEMRMEDK